MVKNSNERFFNQYLDARNDYVHGKYKLASRKLLSLNDKSRNNDVNHLLVGCLYHQKKYKLAERFIFEDVNSYTDSSRLIKLMINVLLKNHEFILCYEIISSFQNHELKENLLVQVQRYEQIDARVNSEALSKLSKKFYHLSDSTFICQRIILRRSLHLPRNRFVMIAKDLLVDPFLVPIMRLSILDILRKVGFAGKVMYRWIDHQVYSIDVSQLSELTDTSSYRQVMKIIKSKYFHNPNQMIALEQNVRLELSYLYPFNDKEITDPYLWVKIAKTRLQGQQPTFINETVKSVYRLQVKLSRLTKNLIK